MNKKPLRKLISLMASTACLFTFAACSSSSNSISMQVDGTIYDDGVQIVTLNLSGSDDASFHSDITAADVTLSGILEDKDIVEVYYVDETTLLLGLAGAVENSTDDTGTITIDASGMSNDKEVSATVQVDFEPYITVTDNSYTNINGTINVSSQYKLPYGYFYEDAINSENIQLKENSGELSYELSDDGYLTISVSNFIDDTDDDVTAYPEVVVSKDASTFNTEISFYVGNDAPIYVVYEGNADDDARLIVPGAPDTGRYVPPTAKP
jgi:hypothetical protein